QRKSTLLSYRRSLPYELYRRIGYNGMYPGEDMKNWTFETLDPAYGEVTEGPAWDGSGLLYTRIQQSRIMRYDPATGACKIHRENTNCANGLTFDAQGRLYACEGGATVDARRVVRYNAGGSVTVLADRYEGKR